MFSKVISHSIQTAKLQTYNLIAYNLEIGSDDNMLVVKDCLKGIPVLETKFQNLQKLLKKVDFTSSEKESDNKAYEKSKKEFLDYAQLYLNTH